MVDGRKIRDEKRREEGRKKGTTGEEGKGDRKIPLHDTDETTLESGTQKCPKIGMWGSGGPGKFGPRGHNTERRRKNEKKKIRTGEKWE